MGLSAGANVQIKLGDSSEWTEEPEFGVEVDVDAEEFIGAGLDFIAYFSSKEDEVT